MQFERRKAMAMAAMASSESDKSPKGSLDTPIIPLLNAINAQPFYFTTSSCSGRISILPQLQNPQIQKIKKKKPGDWVFITHEPADPEIVLNLLFHECPPREGILVFRFEPFIVAVDCLDVESAQSLVATAISCGFRESGITSIHKRIMVAIRCSIRLEVPLGEMGRIIVSPEYVRYLVGLANEKMEANRRRTDGFLQVLQCKGLPGSAKLKINGGHRLQGCSQQDHGSLLDHKTKQPDILPEVTAHEGGILKVSEMQQLQYKHDIYDDRQNGSGAKSTKLYTNHSGICNCNLERESSDIHFGLSRAHEYHVCTIQMRILGQSTEKLFRWGHTASLLDYTEHKQILVFGGFGGLGTHARTNDALLLDPKSGMLKVINAEGSPSPRLGHTSSVVGECLFVIGGRGDPMQIFNDVWGLDTAQNRWQQLACSGSLFHPRHRHASAVVDSKVYVFGGLNDGTIYGSMHVLDTKTLAWNEVNIQKEWPCPRHSHSLVAFGSQLFMFGGYDGEKALGDFYSFDVDSNLWKKERTSGRNPSARFSHSMFVYKNYLGIIGGCPIVKIFQEVALLDLQHRIWKHVTINSIGKSLLVRSTACVVEDEIVIVGGGASCYAFGTMFNEPAKIDLCLLRSLEGNNTNAFFSCGFSGSVTNGTEPPFGSHMQTNSERFLNYGIDISTQRNRHDMDTKFWNLQIERKYAKLGKDILKKFGWLDLRRKVYASRDELHICFPITAKFYAFIQEKGLDFADIRHHDTHPVVPYMGKGFSLNDASLSMVLNILLACGSILCDDIASVKKAPKAPKKILREAVCSLMKNKGISPELLEQLPSRWERLGDMVVLPVTAFKDIIWDSVGKELWPVVARSLGASRLARQGRIAPTGTRDSTLELLVGDNGWVDHLENGILYSFDATKCMFSSGNASEKLRMASLDCRDEIIVDLFAGIGYFVLPFLVKAGAKLVYACEWNPHALEALRFNIRANFVEDRCIILEGDNRDTAPKRVADRVCLGLLPSSENSWQAAVRALRPEGGILHLHGNVNDSEEDSWLEYVAETINVIAKSEGCCWDVSVQHLERVKWYGPHIRHLVADVRCKQLQL